MFQVPASNTLGGVAETRTVFKSVTDIHTDKGKTICPSPLRGGGGGGGGRKGHKNMDLELQEIICSHKLL